MIAAGAKRNSLNGRESTGPTSAESSAGSATRLLASSQRLRRHWVSRSPTFSKLRLSRSLLIALGVIYGYNGISLAQDPIPAMLEVEHARSPRWVVRPLTEAGERCISRCYNSSNSCLADCIETFCDQQKGCATTGVTTCSTGCGEQHSSCTDACPETESANIKLKRCEASRCSGLENNDLQRCRHDCDREYGVQALTKGAMQRACARKCIHLATTAPSWEQEECEADCENIK